MDLESPHFKSSFIPVVSITTLDMTEVIDVRKGAENDTSDGFGSNFSGAAFCLPHQMVGILLSDLAGSKRVSTRTSSRQPVRHRYDDKYRSRSYRFVERQKVQRIEMTGLFNHPPSRQVIFASTARWGSVARMAVEYPNPELAPCEGYRCTRSLVTWRI